MSGSGVTRNAIPAPRDGTSAWEAAELADG